MKVFNTILLMLMLNVITLSKSYAIDAKRYGAIGCNFDANSFYQSWRGTLENTSNTTKTVFCPLTRDMTLGHNDIVGAWVSVRDNHWSNNIRCWLNISYPNGSGYSSRFVYRVTSGSDNTWKYMDFTSKLNNHTYANYVLECSIPGVYNGKRSGIGNYSLSEE